MKPVVNVFWFRRDLRLHDNAGLYHALKAGLPVLPIFIFDRNILDELEDPKDRRVEFIHQSLKAMQDHLLTHNSTLDARHGFPPDVFKKLFEDYDIRNIYTNHDYEPYARQRDEELGMAFKEAGIGFYSFKDQVIFEKNEVLKEDGKPYTVFTPYSRKWKSLINKFYLESYPTDKYARNYHRQPKRPLPSLEEMNFQSQGMPFPGNQLEKMLLSQYKDQRNFPYLDGTSRLSVHLRFGTISIRQLTREALKQSETFLNELIWRDFYQMMIWHFPHIIDHAFKPAYDKITWRNNEKEFEAWCNGKTGYPIVDAGMRELNETGFMHNRVRMVTASFLVKHLLIDWRWGEAYFAKKLLDFDLASNNGGWQWAAGSGADAAPYFRIFNPYIQARKFDPQLIYIRRWVPELEELDYPLPIVDHEFARTRCMEVFGKALKK